MMIASESFITALATANTRRLALQALRAAQERVTAQSAADKVCLEKAHVAEAANAAARAAKIIARIPAIVGSEASFRMQSPAAQDPGGFDCQACVMHLNGLETSGPPRSMILGGGLESNYEPSLWRTPKPEQIHYAARIVFDFCQEAGYNPMLVPNVDYNDWVRTRRNGRFSAVLMEEFDRNLWLRLRQDYRSFLVIRWNLPAGLKRSRTGLVQASLAPAVLDAYL